MCVDDPVAGARGDDLVEASGHDSQRLAPLDRLELRLTLVPDAAKGRLQPCGGVTPRAIISNGALPAEYTAAYRVLGIAEYARFAPPFDHHNPARIVAITRTRGSDQVIVCASRHHF